MGALTSHWWAIPLYALVIAALVTLAWTLIFGRTEDSPEHPPEPDLVAAQHRGETDGALDAHRHGDDGQFFRWRTVPVHIRRRANAEHAAETSADIPTDPERTGT